MRSGAARVMLLLGAASCAAETPPPLVADGREPVRSIPLASCRAMGAMGDPCFPTPSEVGSRPVHPCFERRRGRCGGAGQGMCNLLPISDGKRCSSGSGTCSDLHCVPD